MYSKPRLLQGVFPFTGEGLSRPAPLGGEALTYTVPMGRRAQLVYFRGGNSAAELIAVTLLRDGLPMRHFPIGAKADTHVALAVVEDLEAGTRIEVALAAPSGLAGEVVLDIGMVEI